MKIILINKFPRKDTEKIMAEILSGYRSILSSSKIYDLFQCLMGQKKGFTYFIENFVKPKAGDYILDIGCGTASILEFLPNVHYVGFDKSDDYISQAKLKYGDKGVFCCSLSDQIELSTYEKFDTVMLIGVLHHLDDEEVLKAFHLAKDVLKPGGHLVTEDPTLTKNQNLIARILINLDRGKNVRKPGHYKSLANSVFNNVTITVKHKKFIPYTHAFLYCEN